MVPLSTGRQSFNETFQDILYVRRRLSAGGRMHYSHCEIDTFYGLNVSRETRCFLDDGIQYIIEFDDCENNLTTRVHVTSIVVLFGPVIKNGPTIKKEIGEKLYDYKIFKESISLTKEEVRSLHPLETAEVKKIPVVVQISIKKVIGNRVNELPSYNFYERKTNSTLSLLFADNKKLYTNINHLSMHSEFFKKLGEHLVDLPKDENSGLPLLKLEEYQSTVFNDMLLLLYPLPSDDILHKKESIGEALRLADFLALEIALVHYEKVLADDKDDEYGSSAEKLLWSDQYSMGFLQKSIFGKLEKVSQLMKLRNDPKFIDLPKEMILFVYDKMTALYKKGAEFDYEGNDA